MLMKKGKSYVYELLSVRLPKVDKMDFSWMQMAEGCHHTRMDGKPPSEYAEEKEMSLFIKQCGALLLYCLPAMIALTVVLKNYHNRALEVSVEINRYAVAWTDLDAEQLKAFQDTFVQDNEVVQRLFHVLNSYRALGIEVEHDLQGEINSKVLNVWAFNSNLILAPTLLPYLLLGARLVFGPTTKVDRSTRLDAARSDFLMKLLIAFVIALGWIYVLHPTGRGASLLYEYVVDVDVFSINTLPIYIDSQNRLAATMCGFLGWYLHLLGYFFSKFVQDDVVSTRVYGLLFRKFLFVYGIALVLSNLLTTAEGKAVMFLIGFFPLSALSLLKPEFDSNEYI